MSYRRWLALACLSTIASCASNTGKGSIAQLRDVQVDLTDVQVEASSDKAMESYQKFLEQTPETAMTPEAMRRLADLKIQQDYGTFDGARRDTAKTAPPPSAALPAPVITARSADATAAGRPHKNPAQGAARESNEAFEARATRSDAITPTQPAAPANGANAELKGNAGEAIKLYRKLLDKYPNYAHNDQVLYQLSRAYDELGMTEDAMAVMTRVAREFPDSRYFDEVQFRIGEYYFTRKKFLDAEDAFKSIVAKGPGSTYFELSIYKLGWTFYKQELYEDSLHRFIALLDHKLKNGYDFENPRDPLEHKRIEDTFHVISLAFANLGGAEAMKDYFKKYGKRSYEVNLYGNLGEHYLEKRRYSDAAATYKAFVTQNPYHKVAPHYDIRVIEIYKKGGFPKLVIDANKAFVVDYGLKSAYWQHFDIKAFPEVVGYVKASLKELANHYHALYQTKKFAKNKAENFTEAMRWYHEYLSSFPKEVESPGIHYQMAELLLENKNLIQAAVEFEHTAYDYPAHEKAAQAGYTAVYAYRLSLDAETDPDNKMRITRETIRSSLKFAETFPQHDKAAIVMGAALDDIFAMKDYALAVPTSRKLLQNFPQADQKIRRTAWLILAHSSFELASYADAEEGYRNVLQLTPVEDKAYADLVENFAAAIYKQGEQAAKQGDYQTAATHFLRVSVAAPTSRIRPTADYDGAAALMQLKAWPRAAEVLLSFRANYPGHPLQPEVTKKLALVYKEDGKLALAAAEYERIETETQDVAIRSEALQTAAELYVQAKDIDKAILVYRRYVSYFPRPLELAIETRYKIANFLKDRNETAAYMEELRQLVAADAGGGEDRTDRTRYLAATSALTLAEPVYTQFAQIKLSQPFEKSLVEKKNGMKETKTTFENLLAYQVGDVTAAATFYLAEMYYNFSRSLAESERPDGLSALEKEQYELALEEQVYPFEEKSIQVHEKNVELLRLNIYNEWIEKSFDKLAKLVPARYAKFEESSGPIAEADRTDYLALTDPAADRARTAARAAALKAKLAAEMAKKNGGKPSAPAATEAPQAQPAAKPAAASEQPATEAAPAAEQAAPAVPTEPKVAPAVETPAAATAPAAPAAAPATETDVSTPAAAVAEPAAVTPPPAAQADTAPVAAAETKPADTAEDKPLPAAQ